MTLAELRRAVELLPPGTALTLPREALLEALTDGADSPAPIPAREPERLLTASEVAERLGCSTRYVYAKADSFPFTRRLASRVVRFSLRGLEQWLSRHGKRAA